MKRGAVPQDLFHDDAGVGDVVQALPLVLLQAALHQAAQARRQVRGQGLPVGLGPQDGGQRVADGFPGEEPLAR